MLKSAAFVVTGLVAGLVIATWWGGVPRTPPAAGDLAALDVRVAALETALDSEREQRFVLEDEVAALEEHIAALPAALVDGAAGDAAPRGDGGARTPDPNGNADAPPAVREGFARGPGERFGSDESRVERFIAAGLSADRAQWIVRRTEELSMQMLQAQYDAARTGEPLDVGTRVRVEETLRDELGDADYERYLQALGAPTSVYVRDVLASSPAERAGLQPGDQVVAYAGARIFDMSDLNRRVLEGEPGQMVTVEVLRDGQTMQLYLPRGPVGITGGMRGPRVR
jgi:hypothetical protein